MPRSARPDPPVSLADAVAQALSDDGPLAASLPGFESRPSQRLMAAAVSQTLEEGGVLLAEAGTGTGKTVAYLVPAVLHERRVLVSTGTKNLQEQIFQKDIPLLRQALGRPFTATCMKGRANYLCLYRLDASSNAPPETAGDRMAYLAIREWARETETGDRAELEDLPEELPLWTELSATAETCLGSECPRLDDCFVNRMRQKAADSDVVIVNHHLLCADAAVKQHSFGEVIPECGIAIIDEAHQLEDVATQYFGLSVSNYRVIDLVRDGRRLMARHEAAGHASDDTCRLFDRVADYAELFFSTVRAELQSNSNGARPPKPPVEERWRLTPSLFECTMTSARALMQALTDIELLPAPGGEDGEEGRALSRRARELREGLLFVLSVSDPAFVYFVEIRGRGVFLRATPIDVSSIVREHLLDRRRATVLTSATLAVGGQFDYIRQRLGIETAEEIQLPSEFDYASQSILFLPPGMPDPRSGEFPDHAAAVIRDILERTAGRAFLLFTSHAALRHVLRRLDGTVSFPLLVQGDAPRSVLLREFRRTPNAVLLATSSFWQGVDVTGEALSCVVIDKLPFAVPGDPIVQARIEAITARGGDAFGEYQVPLAILTLLQGIGRLIRHRTDRGVLSILDPRLRTMAYGRRFLSSIPPSPVTHDVDDISRFLGGRAR
ncbi:MAG: ATP-dependent DNA helicase [Vicinamibacterales bacterium]